MRIVIIANESQKLALLKNGCDELITIEWVQSPDEVKEAAIVLDLLFEPTEAHLNLIARSSMPIIINDLVQSLKPLPLHVVCINGWVPFLQNERIEAVCNNDVLIKVVEEVFSLLHKKVIWSVQQMGFIAARIIAMIINEAYLALDEGVSTKEQIDIAMKLGTSYPYGPFEWSERIGLKNVLKLLEALAKDNPAYTAAALLKKEATQ